jgi:hypothetical protein
MSNRALLSVLLGELHSPSWIVVGLSLLQSSSADAEVIVMSADVTHTMVRIESRFRRDILIAARNLLLGLRSLGVRCQEFAFWVASLRAPLRRSKSTERGSVNVFRDFGEEAICLFPLPAPLRIRIGLHERCGPLGITHPQHLRDPDHQPPFTLLGGRSPLSDPLNGAPKRPQAPHPKSKFLAGTVTLFSLFIMGYKSDPINDNKTD